MLTVLSAGLPISAKDILTNAMNEVFDNGVVIRELTEETLRSRVRLSNRSVEVVLVILDGVSSDICKDIEGGLYQSEKYYRYTSDRELVKYLNGKYGLSIELEEDIEENVPVIVETSMDSEDEKYYLDIIKNKEDSIRNLECRIKEMTALYGLLEDSNIVSISEDELAELRDENISLNNQILELNSVCESRNTKIADLEIMINSLKEGKVNIENRLKKLSKTHDELVLELNELKVAYSKQSGVIRDKEVKISELEKKQEKLRGISKENETLRGVIEDNKSVILAKDTEIGNLKVDIQSKERENMRYLKELESLRGLSGISEKLESANGTIDTLKSELASVSSDNDSLNKKIKEKDRVISQLSDNYEDLNKKFNNVVQENEELNERIKSDDESLFQLNKEKLELQSKLSAMEKSVDLDNDTDIYIKEIQDLQNKVVSMSRNIFTNIGMSALPNGSISARVFNRDITFNNITFAFAGSAESRKGAYKCLFDEFNMSRSNDRYLIVDLVSETSIDYVFQAKRTIPGLDWFINGGSVQPYITMTGLRNTQILSVGIGYINDSYFLSIDWNKRLLELENSGYNVILFCGDISNIIGRVLHESFASHGKSIIYVVGNAVGSRTLITNLKGLSNNQDSTIAYFDFNPAISKFYEYVSKSNECKILSSKGKR